MEARRIVERGTHEELLDLRGRYHELIASQREAVRAGGPIPDQRPAELDRPSERERDLLRLVATGKELHREGEFKAESGELFRSVNELIRELEASSASASYDFVCECTDGHCFQAVTMMAAEFDAVSAKPGRYLVALGHERPGADEAVERHERYVVVSRLSPAEQVAAAASGGQRGSEDASSGS